MATETLRPSGVGSETNLIIYAPNTGEANWEDVDEAVADDLTTALRSWTDGLPLRDLYACANSAVGAGTINSVTIHWRVRGAGSFAGYSMSAVRTHATTYDGTQKAHAAGATWWDESQAYALNPNTSSAWTWAEVDAMEIGLTAQADATGSWFPTQVYVVIDYTASITVTPGTLALALTFYAPTVTVSSNITITPGTLALALTFYAPEIWVGTYKVDIDWDNDGDFLDAYEDVSSNVKSVHFTRGKSDELGTASVGQCSITLNNADGLYTPSNSGGSLYGNLLPKRPIRIRAYKSSTVYNLFYGFIEEIIPHPHPSEQDCIIIAVDGLDFLSRHDMATALYKDTLTGTIHGYILTDAGWSTTMRTIDTGQDTVPYWYGHDVRARFAQEEIDDSEQGFSYISGNGYFNFEDRHHRSTATHQTSQATFDNTMFNISYSLNPKNVYNIVKVTVTPWEIQSIAELWRLEDIPCIPTGETYTYWGDASVSGQSVFVDAWSNINDGDTDFTANSQSDGGGTDITSDVSITETKFAKTMKIELENTASIPAYITLLKARGTYYDDQTKVTIKAEDSTSQTTYQKRTFEIDGKYMTDSNKARDYVTYAIGKYKDARAELSMNVMNKNSTVLAQILGLGISDRITVINDELGITSQDFFIDYMEHDISLSGKLHTTTYRLADCINEDFWCLGYSKLGTQTKLGY